MPFKVSISTILKAVKYVQELLSIFSFLNHKILPLKVYRKSNTRQIFSPYYGIHLFTLFL